MTIQPKLVGLIEDPKIAFPSYKVVQVEFRDESGEIEESLLHLNLGGETLHPTVLDSILRTRGIVPEKDCERNLTSRVFVPKLEGQRYRVIGMGEAYGCNDPTWRHLNFEGDSTTYGIKLNREQIIEAMKTKPDLAYDIRD